MNPLFATLGFAPADILLPQGCDLSNWSVVACDQYTAQPEYWERVARRVGDAPSALRLVLPESKLRAPNWREEIEKINGTMEEYLAQGRFRRLPESLIYVERRLSNGKLRRGLVGVVDLERYDYRPGSQSLIRATEGTVLSRIPPRVAVRRQAALELPHVLMLLDDPDGQVVEPLGDKCSSMEQVYDFDLMEGGGHITGYRLTSELMDQVAQGLSTLTQKAEAQCAPGEELMVFAMGDGNHSLAAAKADYEEKKGTPQGALARYALVELGNLHDPSLVFEAIHRVCFGVDGRALLTALLERYPGAHLGPGPGQSFRYEREGEQGVVTIPDTPYHLPVGTLQAFLDEYLPAHGGRVDYIHGAEVASALGRAPGNLAFLLEAIDKRDLFQTIRLEGALPRKTFSMGEAQDKRFYLEAREIR